MAKQTGPKRNTRQREVDLAEIGERWCRRESIMEIAKNISSNRPYKISYVTIHNDVQELIKRWHKTQIDTVDEFKKEELERINMLEKTYWESWINSP
jgi:hypothetical protein